MKALSIMQPWAWLIAYGFKNVENRTWRTDFRGRCYIHAGKTVDRKGEAWIRETFPTIVLPDRYDRGGIVGLMEILRCSPVSYIRERDNPWICGPYVYFIGQAAPMPFVPCRGQLSFFNVPDDLETLLREQPEQQALLPLRPKGRT